MSVINVNCRSANQPECEQVLSTFVGTLNLLPNYTATLSGTSIDLQPTGNHTPFLRISPAATSDDWHGFLDYLAQNPPDNLVAPYVQHESLHSPSDEEINEVASQIAICNGDLPAVFTVLKNALSWIHPRHLDGLFNDIVLPWFFNQYQGGRVVAITETYEADRSEFLLRNLLSLSIYGFEASKDSTDAGRRKPFSGLLPPIDVRAHNILKMLLQYNAPFIDGFCITGTYTTFVFIPSESVHRRAVDQPSLVEVIAPFSAMGIAPNVYLESGYEDVVQPLHAARSAQEILDWLCYWVAKADAMFDRLYDLVLADDGNGNVSVETYVRNILQFERIFFEATWACSLLDPFLQKILSYAILDKIGGFMSASWATSPNQSRAGTEKFISTLKQQFLTQRLSQLYENPFLVSNAPTWLSGIHDQLVQCANNFSYPQSLISGGHIDFSQFGHLSPCVNMPGSDQTIDEETYSAQVIRSIRNTHHGFSELRNGPFWMLSTTSGIISDAIINLPALFCFAMLENPDAAISRRW